MKLIKTLSQITAVLVLSISTTGAFAQDISGDAKAGAKVFKKCAACHNANKAKSKIGPHLMGIIGRPAGAVEGFKYSSALAKAADAGLVWTPEDIKSYLTKPSAMIKGTKMTFPGLKKEKDIANVLAYLAQFKAE